MLCEYTDKEADSHRVKCCHQVFSCVFWHSLFFRIVNVHLEFILFFVFCLLQCCNVVLLFVCDNLWRKPAAKEVAFFNCYIMMKTQKGRITNLMMEYFELEENEAAPVYLVQSCMSSPKVGFFFPSEVCFRVQYLFFFFPPSGMILTAIMSQLVVYWVCLKSCYSYFWLALKQWNRTPEVYYERNWDNKCREFTILLTCAFTLKIYS